MKHHGCAVDFAHDRIRALLRACDTALARCRTIRMGDIYRIVADMPSPRFWVSTERATVVISAMRAYAQNPKLPNPLGSMRPTKREMYAELCRRVEAIIAIDPGLALPCAVERAIHQPAPKFYLTPASVQKLIQPNRKKWNRQKMKKWQRS